MSRYIKTIALLLVILFGGCSINQPPKPIPIGKKVFDKEDELIIKVH